MNKFIFGLVISILAIKSLMAGEGIKLFKEKKYDQAYQVLLMEDSGNRFFYLGVMNLMGKGTEKNISLAKEMWRKGYLSNDEKSGISLALILIDEKTVGGEKEGVEILKALSEGVKSQRSQVELAKIYTNRNSTFYNLELGFKLFKKAAESGSVDAMSSVGLMRYYGEGVEKDLEKALYWYTKAAQLGHVNAQYSLGILNAKKDREQAIFWLTEAANKNHEQAIMTLIGMSQEKPETMNVAMKWSETAVKMNIPGALPMLSVIQITSESPEIQQQGINNLNKCVLTGDKECMSIHIGMFMAKRSERNLNQIQKYLASF